ncbi:MAG: hypothetical protein OEO21_01340 [Candidatus Krumholzibacteria bacterium]|nr:hypothetical protein [Candidatus Krumholzibacteria bacterium]
MSERRTIFVVALLVACTAARAPAQADLSSAALGARATAAEAASMRAPRSGARGAWSASQPAMLASFALQEGAAEPQQQSWWPVLYSAVVPGAGELSMGDYKAGIPALALEIVAWAGYFTKHDQGLETRSEYEAFADANWLQSKWIDDHLFVYPNPGITTPAEMDSIGAIVGPSGAWPGYIPWVSREEDKQHYYENIGKYDWYISGWTDYDPVAAPHETALRDQYRAMRIESNDQLDDANKFIYLSIGVRVWSLLYTTLKVKRARDATETAVLDTENHFTFRAKPKGLSGGVVALEYWFK